MEYRSGGWFGFNDRFGVQFYLFPQLRAFAAQCASQWHTRGHGKVIGDVRGYWGWHGVSRLYDSSRVLRLFLPFPSRMPIFQDPARVPHFISHIIFPFTVTLLFIITCRRGSSSPLSRTLTHYAYLLISDVLYDTFTRCGRPFPGLSCI